MFYRHLEISSVHMKSTQSMQDTTVIYCVTRLKPSLFGASHPQVLHHQQIAPFVVVLGYVP